MMKAVGVRELKTHLSEILRQVQNEGTVVEVTHRGTTIARLSPVVQAPRAAVTSRAIWADLDELAAEIGRVWPPEVSAVEAVRDVRRDL